MSSHEGFRPTRWMSLGLFLVAAWLAPRAVAAAGAWAGVPSWIVSGTTILVIVGVLLGLLTFAAQADLEARTRERRR